MDGNTDAVFSYHFHTNAIQLQAAVSAVFLSEELGCGCLAKGRGRFIRLD